jgi:hypothetical protein
MERAGGDEAEAARILGLMRKEFREYRKERQG